MKRLLILVTVLVLAFSALATAMFEGYDGPAPNAGDGISDGSGFDPLAGPNSDGVGEVVGPAPNAGDGISDGSGLDSPNG